jgi:trehalose 6-phosphate synthase
VPHGPADGGRTGPRSRGVEGATEIGLRDRMHLHDRSARTRPGPRGVPPRATGLSVPTKARAGLAHVVLLSDRGPVRFTGTSDDLVPQPQSSSVTALLHRIVGTAAYPVTWLSPSTAAADGHAMSRGLFHDLASRLGYSPHVVLINEQEYERYYYDAGVSIIWSAWHGIEDDVPVRWDAERPLASLASYAQVNRLMSARAAEVATAGAVVAVQDYQFMLAPAMIRVLRPDMRIVHFSHTPFPEFGSLARLPEAIASTLVNGMLGADLLGFQRAQWAHRFLHCCQQLGMHVDHEHGYVQHQGRRVWARCYPVSVDVRSLSQRSNAPDVRWWATHTIASDRALRVVRVDRLDPAKNALRGFQAYSLLLRRLPALAHELRFVACLIPSRERVPEYRRYAMAVQQVIDDINRRHPGSITVHYGNDQDRALGILHGYDVLLVNPVADGMNLVAQEGSVVNVKDGAVVLSQGAGSADVLTGAVMLHQPRDVAATADALEAALSLSPAERRDRARRMLAALGRMNATEWLDCQLADALAVGGGAAPSCPPPTYPVQQARPW